MKIRTYNSNNLSPLGFCSLYTACGNMVSIMSYITLGFPSVNISKFKYLFVKLIHKHRKYYN